MTRLVATLVAILLGALAHGTAQEPAPPTFKAGVDLVSVSVVVKNHKGKPVTGLSRKHQRQLSVAVKRAREIALLPYVGER